MNPDTFPFQQRTTLPASILVVEDDPTIRNMVVRFLQNDGFDASSAADGMEAEDILAGRSGIDMVLTDFSMPRMDGIQLAQRIRHDHPGTVVCLMSGSLPDALQAAGEMQSELNTIAKPFTARQLLAKVHELLHVRSQG